MKAARFDALAETLERVKATSSKNEKVSLLSAYLAGLSPQEAETAARVATGRPSEAGSKDEAQVGYSTLLDVLMEVCGADRKEVSRIYLRHGDLGEVAEELLARKSETALFSEPLTIGELADALARLRRAKGKGSGAARRAVVKSLLLRASPVEGKYLVKILTREMRTGVVQGLMEEAVGKAFSLTDEEVARGHMLLGDVGSLARAAAGGGMSSIRMVPFRPVNFMLAEPLPDPKAVAEHFGGPAYAEYKYDGVRAQVHGSRGVVRIFSRRLEEVTPFFPEVARAAAGIGREFVLDGEAVPFRDGRPLPFQLLQRRLRRVEGFTEAAAQAPVRYFCFDLLYLDGEEVFGLPLRERSRLLDGVLEGSGLERAERVPVDGEADVARAFRRSRELGYEGLVVKDPEGAYTMGKRGSGWVKLKEELDTIDAVIVAAEYGHGKRAGVISDYTFAVWDGGELKTVGKAYSGLTDEEIDAMTARLKRITLQDMGYRRTVKPEVVLEVAFDSIQRSDRHDSGFALRFPRIKRIRDDKGPADADTLDKVRSIFSSQTVRLDER